MGQEKSGENQITEGTIWKQLLFFFFPILLGTFFQQFYNTIDMVVVGRFVGKEAIASVGGSAGQIVNLVVGFFTGLSAGAGVIISQFFGAKDKKNLNESIHTAYAFSLAGSVVFMLLGVWLSPEMLKLMNTPEEIVSSSAVYLRIYFAGIVFVFIYNVGSGILRALGDSRRPLYFLVICCLLNIVLDLVMVVVFRLGVAGVAIATVLAQAVSAGLVTRELAKPGRFYQLRLKEIRFYRKPLKSQLYVGLPGGFQSVMYSLSNIIIQSAVNVYGTDTAAAWAAQGKLDAIFWMVSGAFGVSITTFVGQNYGAGRYDRIEKSVRVCFGMDFAVSLCISSVLLIFRRPLFGIFTGDAEVIRIGTEIMRTIAPCYVLFIFVEILSSALRGMSDVIIPMLITLFGVCLLRILWIFLAVPRNPSMHMVILNYPVTWVATSVMFIIYYLHRKKRLWAGKK